MDDWRTPYRTMDESGSPEAAGTVAWNWISDMGIAERLRRPHAKGAGLVIIETHEVNGGGRVTVLYRGTQVLACATTFRDEMNHTVLIRWLDPSLAEAG